MIAALLVALSLAAGSNDPKFIKTYPDDVLEELASSCLQAGQQHRLKMEDVIGYCTCHIFVLAETTPYADFKRLREENNLQPLFTAVTKTCVEMGYSPRGKPKS